MSRSTNADLYLELARPDKDGWGRVVRLTEFTGKYAPLADGFGNGGAWCRSDGALRAYNIHREKEKGRIVAVQLQGWRTMDNSRPIPQFVRDAFAGRCCVMCPRGSGIEVDHKRGRKDDPRLNDPERVTVNDFQPMCSNCNKSKRSACQRCEATGIRFDGRLMGRPVSYSRGGPEYNGTCEGCPLGDVEMYHHDIARMEIRTAPKIDQPTLEME